MQLLSLTANFETFRSFELGRGASFIVAERENEATITDSRNGLGKSTALALIDFCLGGNPAKQVESAIGRDWKFTLSLIARNGAHLFVTRSPDRPSDIILGGERVRAGFVDPSTPDDRAITIGPGQWNRWLLGESFPSRGISNETPTWRSLVRHFIRYRNEAFIDPFRTTKNPGAHQIQAENAYLLGLNWNLAGEWAELRADVARLKALDVEDVSLDDKIASIESRLAKSNARLSAVSEEVADFSVVPEYSDVEKRANHTARKIKALTNEIMSDRQMIRLYESKLTVEAPSVSPNIAALFAEAGVHLGEAVVKSLEEADAFHAQVSSNRSHYLEDEVARLRSQVQHRSAERDALDATQREAMRILESGGALEDFAELQRRLAVIQADVSYLENELGNLGRIADKRSRLKSDEIDLTARTRRDLAERFERRADILTRFSEILEELYGEEAELQVSTGRNRAGLQLKTKLPRGGSDGVDRMAIFAYTIAVSEAFAREGVGPGFLIHDSLAFADVDERQTAQAIEIAAASAERHGFQYLATLNSDKIPWKDLSDPQVVTDRIVLKLSDASPSGSLFGMRITPNLVALSDEGEPDATE